MPRENPAAKLIPWPPAKPTRTRGEWAGQVTGADDLVGSDSEIVEHAERAPALPMHHRDAFDRMLVAQAQIEALRIVTADAAIRRYDVEVIDARR